MKQLSLLVILALSLQGCWLSYQTANEVSHRLSNIPTPSHNHEINVIFPGERFPDKPYIKVALFTAEGSESVSDVELINRLKEMAQLEGVDDIVLFDRDFHDKYFYKEEKRSFIGILLLTGDEYNSEGPVVKTTKELTALGIKYIENMDYVAELVSQEQIYWYDEKQNDYLLAALINYDLEGSITSVNDTNSLFAFFEERSLDHLLYDRSDAWRYRYTEDGKIVRKMIGSGGQCIKSCVISMDENNKVAHILLKYPLENINEEIYFSYTEEGELAERVFVSNRFSYLKETRIFNENGTWKEFIYTDVDGKPVMRKNWICFAQEDLIRLVNQ